MVKFIALVGHGGQVDLRAGRIQAAPWFAGNRRAELRRRRVGCDAAVHILGIHSAESQPQFKIDDFTLAFNRSFPFTFGDLREFGLDLLVCIHDHDTGLVTPIQVLRPMVKFIALVGHGRQVDFRTGRVVAAPRLSVERRAEFRGLWVGGDLTVDIFRADGPETQHQFEILHLLALCGKRIGTQVGIPAVHRGIGIFRPYAGKVPKHIGICCIRIGHLVRGASCAAVTAGLGRNLGVPIRTRYSVVIVGGNQAACNLCPGHHAGGVTGRDRSTSITADEAADDPVARNGATCITGRHLHVHGITDHASEIFRARNRSRRVAPADDAPDTRPDKTANIVDAGCGARRVAGSHLAAVVVSDQAADGRTVRSARDRPGAVTKGHIPVIVVPHQAACRSVSGYGHRFYAEFAKFSVRAQVAEKPHALGCGQVDLGVAHHMPIAIEHPGEERPQAADGGQCRTAEINIRGQHEVAAPVRRCGGQLVPIIRRRDFEENQRRTCAPAVGGGLRACCQQEHHCTYRNQYWTHLHDGYPPPVEKKRLFPRFIAHHSGVTPILLLFSSFEQ